jgi:membrane-bound ClpP family serine protease
MEADGLPSFLSAGNGTIIMVLLEGIALGWLLIVIGAVLLLVEVSSPGFFATVPATVMIIFGILLLLGMDIFNNGWGIVIGVVVAIAAAAFTVWMYSRITTDESPTTISRDSLVGKEGQVTKTVDGKTLSGKVRIASTEWSAHSTGRIIPPERSVKVVASEGVHIVVEEVE